MASASPAPRKVSVRRELVSLLSPGREVGEEAAGDPLGRRPSREASIPEERRPLVCRAPVHKSTRNRWKPRKRCTAKGHQRSGTAVIRTGRDFFFEANLPLRKTQPQANPSIGEKTISFFFFCHTVGTAREDTASLDRASNGREYDEAKSDPSDDTIRSQSSSIPRHSHTHTNTTHPACRRRSYKHHD